MTSDGCPQPSSPTRDFDYGNKMVVDSDARAHEITRLKLELEQSQVSNQEAFSNQHAYGINVIIPSYLGRDRIALCLGSLASQSLDRQLFEVILVINGEDDGTFEIACTVRASNPGMQIRVLHQARPSAGAARNLGIDIARYQYLTFVDDDDYVGPEFLKSLLAAASPNRVALAPIINVHPSGELDSANALNLQISSRGSAEFKLNSASSLLGFNACKLIPTKAVQDLRYAEHLRSGEDVSFMAHLAVQNDLDAVVATNEDSGAYYRVLRDESISRQALTFDFAVAQRLEVIRELESRRNWGSSPNETLLLNLIRAQANFIKRYLYQNPGDRQAVNDLVDKLNIRDFPWSQINIGAARDLAISYCFAPFSDTSAVVASKAIVERGKIVDVIYNDMSSARQKDPNLATIAARYIDTARQISAPASFAGWNPISEFVTKGIAVAEEKKGVADRYETLYSRVLWPGSHYLAAYYKIRHPEVAWTAEFSDPMSTDSQGEQRRGDLVRDNLFKVFQDAIMSQGFADLETDSLFTWCEYITYILADELVFTNENQLEYMLSYVVDADLKRLVRSKATVRVHPTPPARSYQLVPSDYPISESVVNIGYFGAFYENRGLSEVLVALANSSIEVRRKVRLHIFTSKPVEAITRVQEFGLKGVVKIQEYRPYLEFLNLSTKFDVLLVNDVERPADMEINPFLPSKYSDYLGAGRPIWALVDEDSSLASMRVAYRSSVGNAVHAISVLKQILADWLSQSVKSEVK